MSFHWIRIFFASGGQGYARLVVLFKALLYFSELRCLHFTRLSGQKLSFALLYWVLGSIYRHSAAPSFYSSTTVPCAYCFNHSGNISFVSRYTTNLPFALIFCHLEIALGVWWLRRNVRHLSSQESGKNKVKVSKENRSRERWKGTSQIFDILIPCCFAGWMLCVWYRVSVLIAFLQRNDLFQSIFGT